MLNHFLKSRLGPLRVTASDPLGPPGLSLDSELLAAARIMPGERVRAQVHGGPAFWCYAAPARRASGTVAVAGALGVGPDARVTVTTECLLVEREALTHEAREVAVDGENHPLP